MKKKLISLLMVIAMMFSMLPADVIDIKAATGKTATISVERKNAIPGSTVSVNVSIKDNPGILGSVLRVEYDSKLTLTDATSGVAFGALVMTKPGKFGSPSKFVWDGQDLAKEDIKDGVILNLTFNISKNAKEGDELGINVYCENAVDTDLNDVNVKIENSAIKILSYTPGDLNGDGKVNSTDVILTRRYIVGGYNQNVNELAADVNRDGRVNSADVILLRRYIAGGYGVELDGNSESHKHTMEHVDRVDATCTEDGNQEYWHCTDCNKYFSDINGINQINLEDTVINAKGHTVVIDEAVPATTTRTGLTEGSHCSECGIVIKEQTIIPKTEGYSISYNISNGDNYLAQQKIDNSKNPTEYYKDDDTKTLEDLEAPEGYRFLGWYDGSGSNATQIKEIKKGKVGNIRLYAHWEEITYDITYKLYQTPLAPISDEKYLHYTVSKGLVDLPNPTLYNYIFLGWYDKDGKEVTKIPTGTVGDVELNAYWTSKRNLTKKVDKIEDPVIIENPDKGVMYFTYEIGTIENVPLSDAIWTIQSVSGLAQQTSKTVTTSISDEQANNIVNSISQATVDSKTWTLSSDWNDSTTVNESWAETNGMTQEEAITKAKTSSNTFSLTTSDGGSHTNTKNDGTTTLTYDSKNEAEDSGEDKVKEKGSQLDIGVNGKYYREKSATAKIPELGEAGGKSGFEIGGNVDWGKYDKNTTTTYGKKTTNKHSGSDKTTVDTNVATDVHTWNSAATSSSTQTNSESRTVSNVLSKVISNTKEYGKSYSYGGSNSEAQGQSSSLSESTNTSSTLSYSKSDTTTTTTTYSTDGKSEGCYRLVVAGTVHVFAVVGYDVASKSYFTYTYNVMDDKTYDFLDYSPNLKFNDCENGAIPFEVPIDVKEYVDSRVVRTNGLIFRTNSEEGTAKVVRYDGEDKDVIIPCYVSVGKKSYKVTEIDSTAFAGKDINSVVLSDYIDEIPNAAFKNCAKLKSISGYFTKIGDEAFMGCTGLGRFNVSSDIKKIGSNAFKDVPVIKINAINSVSAIELAEEMNPTLDRNNSEELKQLETAAKKITGDWIEGVLQTGAKKMIIDISTAFEGTDISMSVPELDYFEIVGGKKTYKNLQLNSNAKETVIKELSITDCKQTPLIISSDKLTLEEVSVVNDGFALLLAGNGSKVTLIRDNRLVSNNGKAIVSKNPVFVSEVIDSTLGVLEVSGDIYNCGSITGQSNIDFIKGKLISISDEEFEKYIKGVFKITFNANGGNLSEESKDIYYGEKVGIMPEPTRDDCTFLGWYTDDGKQITENTVYNYANDITVKARWQSDWQLDSTVPQDATVTDEKWTYDLTTKTTSDKSTLDGYTLYDSSYVWGNYGSWSGWSDYPYYNSDSRKVETQSVPASYKTQYNYKRYISADGKTSGPTSGYWGGKNCTTYQERGWSDSALAVTGSQNSNSAGFFYLYGSAPCWYYEWTRTVVASYKTQYRYADRSKIYTYYFKKTEQKESTSEIQESDSVSNVQKWVKYTI